MPHRLRRVMRTLAELDPRVLREDLSTLPSFMCRYEWAHAHFQQILTQAAHSVYRLAMVYLGSNKHTPLVTHQLPPYDMCKEVHSLLVHAINNIQDHLRSTSLMLTPHIRPFCPRGGSSLSSRIPSLPPTCRGCGRPIPTDHRNTFLLRGYQDVDAPLPSTATSPTLIQKTTIYHPAHDSPIPVDPTRCVCAITILPPFPSIY